MGWEDTYRDISANPMGLTPEEIEAWAQQKEVTPGEFSSPQGFADYLAAQTDPRIVRNYQEGDYAVTQWRDKSMTRAYNPQDDSLFEKYFPMGVGAALAVATGYVGGGLAGAWGAPGAGVTGTGVTGAGEGALAGDIGAFGGVIGEDVALEGAALGAGSTYGPTGGTGLMDLVQRVGKNYAKNVAKNALRSALTPKQQGFSIDKTPLMQKFSDNEDTLDSIFKKAGETGDIGTALAAVKTYEMNAFQQTELEKEIFKYSADPDYQAIEPELRIEALTALGKGMTPKQAVDFAFEKAKKERVYREFLTEFTMRKKLEAAA